jgi:hypothetical protein
MYLWYEAAAEWAYDNRLTTYITFIFLIQQYCNTYALEEIPGTNVPLSPYFLTFIEPRYRFQRMNSASLYSLAARYKHPTPTRFLAPIDCLKFQLCFCSKWLVELYRPFYTQWQEVWVWSETHTKRKATQHGCLPSLLGDGVKRNWNSVWWGKKYFVLCLVEQTR